MADSFPYWPSFRTVQRPDSIVGSAVSSMLRDLNVNQIPDYRYIDVPVKVIPRPKIGEAIADSAGFSESRGQVSSSLFAMLMAPMDKKAITAQTDPKKAALEDGEDG